MDFGLGNKDYLECPSSPNIHYDDNISNTQYACEFQSTFIEDNERKKLILEEEKHSQNCKIQYKENLKDSYSNENAFSNNEKLIIEIQDCSSKSIDVKISQNTGKEKIPKRTTGTLNTFSVKELQLLNADLAQTVNEVSNELVSLLQENDTLRQESDARNIAIEQLLKLTVKQSDIELRPVKLSVVSSTDTSSSSEDEWD